MTQLCKNNQIDVLMLSETNKKQTTGTPDVISSRMKALGRETRCFHADSKLHKTTDADWLQVGTKNVKRQSIQPNVTLASENK